MRSLLLVLLMAAAAFGQQPTVIGPDGFSINRPPEAVQRQLGVKRPILSSAVSNPQEQTAKALKHLQLLGQDPEVARGERALTGIRFFTLYSVPPEYRWDCLNALNLTLNSLSFNPDTIPAQPVPDSEGLLYWVHLDDYLWTDEAWEKVSVEDPFFREPWIDHDTAAALRLTAGNAILRADWFINRVSDTNISNSYYDLLFASVAIERKEGDQLVTVKGQPPADLGELHRLLHVDVEAASKFGSDRGVLVPSGTSEVAYHNRILWRVPISSGYYWQTFDVKEAVGKKNFVEFRFPEEWDGSEIIYSLPNGLQGYLLASGDGKRVEKGPADLVRDTITPLSKHSPEVRTWQSCVACHTAGLRPASDNLSESLQKGLELYEKTKNNAVRTRLFYRGDQELYFEDDQKKYAVAVKRACGVEPEEASRNYITAVTRYRDLVTVDQAALECGVSREQLKAAMSFSTKGLIGQMATQERPIDRTTWDKELFTEAMLLILEWRKSGLVEHKK